MPTPVRITVGEVLLDAEFFDTPCAGAVIKALPIETRPSVWGDEFYFTIPVQQSLDATATTKVVVGDIGYWPPGSALALFFGPTPMSPGAEPVPASDVNIVGRIKGDATALRKVKGAAKIRIEAV
jgi:uncharacterized protein